MDFEEMRNAYERATKQDIVEKLQSLIGGNYATWDIDADNAMQEAVDEIERLRAENKSLEIDVNDWRTLSASLTIVLQKNLNK